MMISSANVLRIRTVVRLMASNPCHDSPRCPLDEIWRGILCCSEVRKLAGEIEGMAEEEEGARRVWICA